MSAITLSQQVGQINRATSVMKFPTNSVTDAPKLTSNPSDESCDLDAALDSALSFHSQQFKNKLLLPHSPGINSVRVSNDLLQREIGLILDGMADAGLWSDGILECIYLRVEKCLQGHCVVIEFKDEKKSLPTKLMSELALDNSIRSTELPGWQLLKAKDLIARHGGRLLVKSPLWERHAGTIIRLYVPITTLAKGLI